MKGPWGQEVWHRSPVRDEYFYGVFWEGMPDLNYANPAVREEAKKVARFWLQEMGVDGFRLDAIPYLIEEGEQLAHTAGTHAVLREYARYLNEIAPRAYTIGEVWDSIGAMMPYYPDQLHAHFAFEVSDAILDAVRTGSAKRLLQPVLRLQRELPADRWSPFLRNHDQTRTLTALGGDIRNAKLAATILLTLPGLPYVYYGEEIGMTGDKPDPRLRTPMQWSGGAGVGFTRGKEWEAPQSDSANTNVAAEDRDPASLLNLYRRLIHLREQNAALANGTLLPLVASTDSIAAYLRRAGDRIVMVVANLGATPLTGVKLTSEENALPAGRYNAVDLLGSRSTRSLISGSSGLFREYSPVDTLGPKETLVLNLIARRPNTVSSISRAGRRYEDSLAQAVLSLVTPP